MALLAGFSPEQIFCFGRALSHPLRRSENANRRRQRLTREVAPRVALHAHCACMCGNVFAECSDQKCAYDFGLVVWNTKVEAFVKRQQVARSASVREFHRRHQLTTRGWIARCSTRGSGRTETVRVSVGNGRS